MLESASLAYISSILGKGTKVITPLALECAFVTSGNNYSMLDNLHTTFSLVVLPVEFISEQPH